jgi:hypothetical protein
MSSNPNVENIKSIRWSPSNQALYIDEGEQQEEGTANRREYDKDDKCDSFYLNLNAIVNIGAQCQLGWVAKFRYVGNNLEIPVETESHEIQGKKLIFSYQRKSHSIRKTIVIYVIKSSFVFLVS